MTPRYPYWYVRQRRFLSNADLDEIKTAEPDYLTAQFVMDAHDRHRCVLYLSIDSRTWERVAEGTGMRAIEAFRHALSRIELLPVLPEFARWRDTDVEVVDGAA